MILKESASLIWPVLKNVFARNRYPLFCTYSVTWRCNARCRMCNIWKKKHQPEMDLESIKKAFRQIPGITAVRLTGGEPFLRDDLAEIADIIYSNTDVKTIMITSNGILTDRIVDFIKNSRKKNIRIKISVTGFMDTHDKIAGHKGAFQKIMETIEALKVLQERYEFSLGVNHTIIDMNSYEDAKKIRVICRKYGMPYLPVIAYGKVPLYSEDDYNKIKDPRTEEYIDLPEHELKIMLEDLIRANREIDSWPEKLLKLYYLKGLYSKKVLNEKIKHTGCTVLRNHIRLLPNGDIPVCLYNSETVGNIVTDDFEQVWKGSAAERMRKWVDNCSKCWLQCDIFPNLIYSGEIFRYLMYYGISNMKDRLLSERRSIQSVPSAEKIN